MKSPDSSPERPARIKFRYPFTDRQRRGLSSGITPIDEVAVQRHIDLIQGKNPTQQAAPTAQPKF